MAEPSRGRILVIDDEEPVRIALRRTLRRLGFEIEEATSVEEGLQATRRLRPDIVFLDLMMPGTYGTEFLRRLKAAAEGLEPSVIVMSGHGGVEDVIDVLRLGAVDYVRKPWNLTELTSAVTSALEAQRVARRSVLAPASSEGAPRRSPEGDARQARLQALADRLSRGAVDLPLVPPVVAALEELRPPASAAEVAEILDRHPAFAAHVGRIARATVPQPSLADADTTAAAVSHLGARHAINLVQTLALRRFCDLRQEFCAQISVMVWKRSAARASAMRALADVLDPSRTLDGDTAYRVGLLADIGALLLFWVASESAQSGLTAEDAGDAAHLLDFARRQHQELSASALRSWKAESAVELTASHHHRQTPPASEVAWWNLFILGDDLAGHVVAEADPLAPGPRDPRAVERSSAEFGLPRSVLENLLVQVKDELAAVEDVPPERVEDG